MTLNNLFYEWYFEFTKDGEPPCQFCGNHYHVNSPRELLHGCSGGSTNRRILARYGYNADLIDLPLINTLFGCAKCNKLTYESTPTIIDQRIVAAATMAVKEYGCRNLDGWGDKVFEIYTLDDLLDARDSFKNFMTNLYKRTA